MTVILQTLCIFNEIVIWIRQWDEFYDYMISYCNNVADTVSSYIRIYRKKFTSFKSY